MILRRSLADPFRRQRIVLLDAVAFGEQRAQPVHGIGLTLLGGLGEPAGSSFRAFSAQEEQRQRQLGIGIALVGTQQGLLLVFAQFQFTQLQQVFHHQA